MFAQERFEFDEQSISSSDIFYNVVAHLTLLGKKPYPLILFYTRQNPRVPLQRDNRFFRTNTQYGFKLHVQSPSFPLKIEGERQIEKGDDFNRITDEQRSYLTIHNDHIGLWRGKASLTYEFEQKDSASGYSQSPIKHIKMTTHLVKLTTEQSFGSQEQVTMNSYTSVKTRAEPSEESEFRTSPHFHWTFSDSLFWAARYEFKKNRVEERAITNHFISQRLNYQLYRSLLTDIECHGSRQQVENFGEYDLYGTRGTLSYRKQIPFGSFSLRYSGLYDIRDTHSLSSQLPVIGEPLSLHGIEPKELANTSIIPSSIQVFTPDRSMMFQEYLDYRLITVGEKISIQRIVTGNIPSGETIIVDYVFSSLGTLKTSSFESQYEAGLSLFSHLSLLARLTKTIPDVLEGVSEQPLNERQSRLYRAELRIPLDWLSVNVAAEHEKYESSEAASFRRFGYNASFQIPIHRTTTFALSGRYTSREFLHSDEILNFKAARVRLNFRPKTGIALVADLLYEENTVDEMKDDYWLSTLNARWQFRDLLLHAEGQYIRQSQQLLSKRDKLAAKIEVRRRF